MFKKTFMALLALMLAVPVMADNAASAFLLHKYAPGNGGIVESIAPDGKWAVINLGTSAGGGSCPSELMNMETGEHFTVSYSGNVLSFGAISNVDENGYATIVGSLSGRPMSYRFKPSEPETKGEIKVYANRTNWASGSFSAVTPDGKYAVGSFTGYTGKEVIGAELNGDYWFDGLYANLETGTVLETPGAPKADRYGIDQHAMKFTAISPDGKHILGQREWYIPVDAFTFIYDVEKQDFTPVAAKKEGNKIVHQDDIFFLDFPVMSPNGRYIGGTAVIASETDGNYSEGSFPFRYDCTTGEMRVFNDKESSGIEVGCIDDNGTIFGNPGNGTPLRNFRIFYQDKYWIPFAQLCQQVYGFNFSERTGFEFSGTATSVSADGKRFVAFSDPLGESYAFDFGMTVEESCAGFDLLNNYSVSPQPGSAFAKMGSVEINFGRAVQVLGKGNTHLHLYKKGKNGAADTKVCDGLSTTGESGGLHLKKNSSSVVVGTFRTRLLESGEDYYVVLDAGAVAPAADASMTNKEIRISYVGRSDGPVKVVSAVPEANSGMTHLDASSSYVMLTFDCPVILTNEGEAYLERINEDGTTTRQMTLTMAQGNTEATKNQILVYPSSTVYLYNEVKYRVVVGKGTVSDYAGTESSYNEEWSIDINGTYVREVATGETMFFDDFNSPNISQTKWLLYEGDHNTPTADMKALGFDNDNNPWNFSTHDTTDSPDYYATSHSIYAPSATSDDWMMTPQLIIPEDGKATLEFDAQKRKQDKNDHLWVYVIPESRNIGALNDNNMKVLKEEAILLEEIADLNAGTTEQAAGNWHHYTYKLDRWAGKEVYIAFANKNYKEDMVLVDNVKVQREILYAIGFSNEDRVVNQDNIAINGTFTIKTEDFTSGAVTLTLKDAEGNAVSTISWPNISGTSIKDRPIPMKFNDPLPLTVGKENKFTIDVAFDGKDKNGNDYKNGDTYQGTIYDLAFETTKRVVLEEMTGVTCPNCPQGIISIEACKSAYKDRFIPISIHSYTNDPFGAAFYDYTDFIGLNAAPTARINRIAGNESNKGVYFPMWGEGNKTYYDKADQELWYNIVGQELSKHSLCDVDAIASYTNDGKKVNVKTDVKYALDTEQQLSVMQVVLEDGIVYYQENNFANSDAEGLGEWGMGGIYGSYMAAPVTHDDLVRGIVSTSYAGTPGLLPQKFEADKVYTVENTFDAFSSVADPANAYLVVMLIDRQSGEIINAVKTKIAASDGSEDGIESVTIDADTNAPVYTPSGVLVSKSSLPAGLYIKNGKKFIVR